MAITSNLYPPIVPDVIPAFLRKSGQGGGICRIYFSLSNYNSRTDIKNVQISIINQRTNVSALDPNNYPSGIKIADVIPKPELDPNDDNYEELMNLLQKYTFYTTISSNDLVNQQFELNQFYKVQLRFTSNEAKDPPPSGKKLAEWLYNEKSHFSEWSKTCIIKGIGTPNISIRGFSEVGTSEQVILSNPMVEVIGELYYNEEDKEETEYLKSYNIKIYQSDNLNQLVTESGEIYTDPHHPNEFNYQIKYELFDGVNYTLYLTYTTNNLYTQTKKYQFKIVQYNSDILNANIFVIPDEENGRIKINITSSIQDFIGNITIRRSSSKSNFHKWEDIHTAAYATHSSLNLIWYDNTIESGVWYKYIAQKRNSEGSRGTAIGIENNPVMCVFEDMFLTRQEGQLKIKFNPTISEFKYNVTESQQNSIGSKYPFIKRNGNNYYRTFSIGGLISSLMDMTDWYDPHFYDNQFHTDQNEIKLFTSKNEIFENSKSLYDNYNNNNKINEYNDIIYEKEFRNKVYDFLYKNNVKLFRSSTEGNILVKLMNIAFQPTTELGRRLYSFTATAVEIDEANISNYDKYKIQTIGQYQKDIYEVYETFGQIQGTYSNNDIILNKINSEQKNSINEGFINEIICLKQLKLEIESEPYIIIEQNGKLIKATKDSTIDLSKALLGYIIKINENKMVIRPNMIREESFYNGQITQNPQILYSTVFELQGDNINITQLSFEQPTTVKISYIAKFKLKENTSNLFEKIFYYNNVGQLYGTFDPEISIIKKISKKYLLKNDKYYQQLLHINDIKLEGLPGIVVYIKDSKDNDYNRHILQTGFLQLKEDDIDIDDLYFNGLHLYECKNPLRVNGLTDKDFELQPGIYKDFNEILQLNQGNLKNGGVYQIRGYGILSGAYLYNHSILVINNNELTPFYEDQTTTPDQLYSLAMEAIDNDENLQFVYYYNCWYLLKDGYEKTKLLKYDYRHIYEDEFIVTNQFYTSFDEITSPIINGVYYVDSIDFAVIDESEDVSNLGINNQVNYNNNADLLLITENHVILKNDHNYSLIERLLSDSNRYIYYHNTWYHFTSNHDVLCPIDGIIDYSYELMKGEYLNNV